MPYVDNGSRCSRTRRHHQPFSHIYYVLSYARSCAASFEGHRVRFASPQPYLTRSGADLLRRVNKLDGRGTPAVEQKRLPPAPASLPASGHAAAFSRAVQGSSSRHIIPQSTPLRTRPAPCRCATVPLLCALLCPSCPDGANRRSSLQPRRQTRCVFARAFLLAPYSTLNDAA